MSDLLDDISYWRPPAQERAALADHLRAEIPPGHVLWPLLDGLAVFARGDGDHVLVRTGDPDKPWAHVRMTWRGRPEIAPFLPETLLYGSDDALREALLEGRKP